MKELFKFVRNSLLVIFLIFIVVGVFLAIKAYNNTWTIEDNHFKTVYDSYDDCMKTNLGTGTTSICDDEKQVKYKNDSDN